MPGDGSSHDRDRLVAAYWKFHRLFHRGDRSDRREAGELWWAIDAVDEAIEDRADDVVDLLVALADAVADDDEALGSLGAGPLEDLLSHSSQDLPPDLLDDLDDAARRNPSLRRALSSIWWSEGDDPALVARFERFKGPP